MATRTTELHEWDSSCRLYAHSLFCLTRRARSVGGRRTTSQNMYAVAADSAYLAVLTLSGVTMAVLRHSSGFKSREGLDGVGPIWGCSLTT